MNKSILFIITGSIAAYKVLDVIRRLREYDIKITCILTKGGAEFLTPLTLAAISGNPVYTDLFSLKDEAEMGHIRLSRENDLIVVLPASADFIAKMVAGMADDLATATLLASDKPVLIFPAMNTRMWEHPATRRNIAQLRKDGIEVVEPARGELACGEEGVGRLVSHEVLFQWVLAKIKGPQPLAGISAMVTSGPTYEDIDPVRHFTNKSSGRQGHAIARALAAAGAQVTLVAGPTNEPDPKDVHMVYAITGQQMYKACMKHMPRDVAICAAAVSDWRLKAPFKEKLKKRANESPPTLELTTNPDILYAISSKKRNRPLLVIGFAAETENIKENAAAKRLKKQCDWIIGNDVSGLKVFGQSNTSAFFITDKGIEEWGDMSKQELAEKLVERIAEQFKNIHEQRNAAFIRNEALRLERPRVKRRKRRKIPYHFEMDKSLIKGLK